MINTNENKVLLPKKEDEYIDAAELDVQCHIIIKDKDTGEVILNKRG